MALGRQGLREKGGGGKEEREERERESLPQHGTAPCRPPSPTEDKNTSHTHTKQIQWTEETGGGGGGGGGVWLTFSA